MTASTTLMMSVNRNITIIRQPTMEVRQLL